MIPFLLFNQAIKEGSEIHQVVSGTSLAYPSRKRAAVKGVGSMCTGLFCRFHSLEGPQ